jgi:uncharacterized repeat protein (TIGR03803 family)
MTRRLLSAASHVVLVFALVASARADTPVDVLYSFSGSSVYPTVGSPLMAIGSTLYGTTRLAGDGTIYSFPIGGSSITTLHSFSGSDGDYPFGVTAIGSTLYGVTSEGGSSGSFGTAFSVGADGSNFTVLDDFPFIGGTSQTIGWSPGGALAAVGTTLYGANLVGGAQGHGAIFSIGTSPASINAVAPLPSGAVGNAGATSPLLAVGSTLYGLAVNNSGVTSVFSVGTNGSNYTTLHSYSGSTVDFPSGLIAVGNVLYGELQGPAGTDGELFSMNLDGSNFTVLHSFSGPDGSGPIGGLTLVGSTLYGVTGGGGANNDGAIFSIGLNGTGFATLHSFTGSDGEGPTTGLTLVGSTLYGATVDGGANGVGALFSFPTPEPSSIVLAITAVPLAALMGRRARRRGERNRGRRAGE